LAVAFDEQDAAADAGFLVEQPTSLAARVATSSKISSDSKASIPIIEIEVFGSNETSCRPGIRYLMTLLIASPPPQATILSKYCG
jgi:hypothetical protein